MRQEQFYELIKRFETDPYFGIRVLNLSTGLAITSDKDKDALIDEYGSVANFFNQIFSTGITQIAIRTRRKNGTTKNGTIQNWKDGKEPLMTFNLEPNTEVQTFAQPVQPVQPQFQPNAPVQYSQPSLASPGLSFPETVSLYLDRDHKIRLDTENKFLKEKCERLEKECYDYKERELASKYSSDKSDKNTELILGLVQHADKLKGIFSPAQAIAPVETMLGNPNVSPIKQSIISAIHTTDDLTADILARVYDALATNDEFANKLNALLQE